MAGRRYPASEVSVDRYDDRRPSGRSRGLDDRYYDDEIEYRSRSRGPGMERDTTVREEVRVRDRPSGHAGPEFLRSDYGRTDAGPVVLRAREKEEFEFVPRQRRRSPSVQSERRVAREEVIIRRDETPPRAEPLPLPPLRGRDRGFDREEIIIRRGDPEPVRRPPPPRSLSRDRVENVISLDTRGGRSRLEVDIERDEVISRRGDDPYDRRPPRDTTREEIIIRRDERTDDRDGRIRTREYDDYVYERPKSHERERSRGRRGSDADEIIIRRDERDGRGVQREREEIVIKRRSRSRSRSPSPASSVRLPPEPVIRAPPIHQEIITHHRHIDHGYELALAPIPRPRPVSRPPSPPMAPPPREEERIEIRRTGERNGRAYDEDIIIDRQEGGRARPPPPPPPPEVYDPRPPVRGYDSPARRDPYRDYRGDRDLQEEAEYYNNRALERSYVGEAYNGATRDWGLVDIPPGTNRVRMDGAGGGAQEITWQRYNGVRRSKFMPDGNYDDQYDTPIGRPLPASGGDIGRRYGPGPKDPRDGLWTEITKDLVIKEAITEAGYDFEETDEFYYIFQFLRYEDVARLVGLSDDIKSGRRKRVQQLEWENRVLPPPAVEPARLAIEPPPMRRGDDWEVEEDRYIEREVVYRGGRPPPAPRWR